MAPKPQGNPKQIDPDVSMPPAVRRAAEEANRLQAAQNPQPPQNPPEPPAPPANDTITIVEPPAPQPLGPTTVSNEPAVTQQGNQPPVPPTTASPELPENDESWKRKFEGAQGRNKQLRDQLLTQQTRIDDLEALVSAMRASPQPVSPPAPATPAAPLITQKDIEEYGPDMLDVMARRAKESVSPEIAGLQQQIAQLEQKLSGTTEQIQVNTRRGLYDTMDRMLPDWRVINDKDEFKIWLGLPDAYTGAKRHNLLMQAFEQNDSARVLAFFKGFLAEEAAMDTAMPVTPAAPAPAQLPEPQRPGLEQFAAPGRAKTSAGGNAPDEKPIITTAQINAFYAAKRKNLYAGKEDEANRLEAMIFEAQREGRIRAT